MVKYLDIIMIEARGQKLESGRRLADAGRNATARESLDPKDFDENGRL
jgi:hypothetical protein